MLDNFNVAPVQDTEAVTQGVSRENCSKNMQQTYRRTPMPKCDFNKSHFGMGVLL